MTWGGRDAERDEIHGDWSGRTGSGGGGQSFIENHMYDCIMVSGQEKCGRREGQNTVGF